jgi:hydroxylamine reductase
MFCFQCQEALKNEGCTVKGVCGKNGEVAGLQDVLIYAFKGMSRLALRKLSAGESVRDEGRIIIDGLFATITNGNFDPDRFVAWIDRALAHNRALRERFGLDQSDLDDFAGWDASGRDAYYAKMEDATITRQSDPDVRSLREFTIYGLKGIAAYAHHARVLGYEDDGIYEHIVRAFAATTEDRSVDELVDLVVKTGETAVTTMKLLDEANTGTYGHPEITTVDIGVGTNPGILISGHDLKDMEELLKQTEGTGVDVYTHSEMLPANYYPTFKKYAHFHGNYGGSWWRQSSEFASFNGPILMTTNCITPVKEEYKDRIFTTGVTGYPEVPHIPDRPEGGVKDFSRIIELAKQCDPPKEIETGTIVGGFAHHQVELLADKIVDAVKAGKIKRFVVMGGCDGRHKSREHFTEVAKQLPDDAVILASGCAKYRYIKLDLGDIDGIPRVLDAGQCNDSYSIAVIALKLRDILGAESVNDLPVDFDVAWYEQKAVAVLLALLALGFQGVRIGPTFPAFVSENVGNALVEKFALKATATPEEDVAAIMA